MMSDATTSIRRYYERNTRLFLALGQPPTATMHRALWGAGVITHAHALNYSHQLVLAELPPHAACVLDLGCGVGGSLFYLMEHAPHPLTAFGLTLSPLQARLAHGRPVSHPHRPHFLEADFAAVPLRRAADLVYSIEAYVHAPDPNRFMAEAARLLRPGGRLLLIDDFRTERALTSAEQFWVQAYQTGWHVPNVQPPSRTIALAEAHGLRLLKQNHLTPLIRLRALPNVLALWLYRAGQRLPQSHPIVPSMLGSVALQQCLHMGVVEYWALGFARE